MRKRINSSIVLFFCLWLIFGTTLIFAKDTGSVENLALIDCIKFALEQHPEIESAQFNLFEAEVELKKLQLQDPLSVAQKDYQAAEKAVASAREALTKAKMNLALDVESKYYQILKFIQTVKNKKYSLDWAKKQMSIVQIKYSGGLIPEKEFIAMEERLLEAEKEYNRALFNLETGRMELNLVMGRELDQFFELKDTEFSYEPMKIDLETATNYALEHSESIKSARESLEKAKEQLLINQQDMVPEIELKKAEYRVKEAETNLKRAEQQLMIQIRNAYMGFISNEDMIKETRKALEEAKDNLEVLSIKYEAGMIPLSSFLEGQRKLADAEISCIQVIYDYNLAKASFNQSIGKGYSLYQSIQQGSDNL